jgi:hypothetical protein
MNEQLERLVREREPDVDQLERERHTPPLRPYRDGFYVPLEQLTLSGIEATFARERKNR